MPKINVLTDRCTFSPHRNANVRMPILAQRMKKSTNSSTKFESVLSRHPTTTSVSHKTKGAIKRAQSAHVI